MRRMHFGLRLQLLSIGLLGVLMALVITESALVGLRKVHRSDDAVNLIRNAQGAYEHSDLMHDALRADVYNALLVSRGVGTEQPADVRRDMSSHIATMGSDVREIAALKLTGPLARAFAGLDAPLQAYAAAAEGVADVAFRNPSQVEPALREFDATFRRLERAQAVVTSRTALAVKRSEAEEQDRAAVAQQRILWTSIAALIGLLLLTGMLVRMGKTLARTIGRQRSVAETLQHSLLPDRLPELPGMSFAARYLPGSSGVEVGGDWYDVIELPTGEVGLIMGDVVGHDLHAASVMGQIRNALRAYALEGLSPADALTRLNRFVRQIGHDEMATCAFAVFHPEASTLLLANAGHYPPLLIGPDRESVFLEHAPCPPVGGAEQTTYTERLYHVLPGSTVLLYTDGLIERRAEAIGVGLERLRQVVADGPGDVDAFCEHIVAELFAHQLPGDDVALLALTAHATLGEHLQLTVPAVLTQLAPLRHTLSRWLTEARATPEEVFELTVACCEAASNAIGHAYGPHRATFQVTADIRDRAVDIRVTDRGQWRPTREGEDHRGRGLDVIKAFTDNTVVEQSDEGTTVHMQRRLADVPALEVWQGIS